MGLGPQPYATSTRGDSRTDNEGTDTSPLTPVDSVQEEFYSFDDLLIKELHQVMFHLQYQEETGQQVQFTIITDMITETE